MNRPTLSSFSLGTAPTAPFDHCDWISFVKDLISWVARAISVARPKWSLMVAFFDTSLLDCSREADERRKSMEGPSLFLVGRLGLLGDGVMDLDWDCSVVVVLRLEG